MEITVVKLSCGEATKDVRIEKGVAWLDARRVELAFQAGEAAGLELWLSGVRHRAVFAHDGKRLLVWCGGRIFAFERAAARSRTAEHAGDLIAPMPGRVRKTLVGEGDRVAKGQVVLILEAMKMEHAIRAPQDGRVERLAHREGDLVEAGAELAVIA
jgi:3-methylcrotonyl-CoA carboxylase alpha subunit